MNPNTNVITLGQRYPEINIPSLHTYDKMRVLLEQAMFTQYILITCGRISSYERKLQLTASQATAIPPELHSENETLNSLYRMGVEAIFNLCQPEPLNKLSFNDYVSIFEENLKTPENIPYYKGSIDRIFLKTFCAFVFGIYDTLEYPNGIIYNANIYTPSEVIQETHHSEIRFKYIETILVPIAIPSLDINAKNTANASSPCGLLAMCDLREFNIEDVIGIMASFALDHTKFNVNYDMHDKVSRLPVSVSDICFDLITGSAYVAHSAGFGATDSLLFLQTIEQLVTSGKLQTVEDYALFGDLLARLQDSAKLVNYFKKSVNEITASEAQAFKASPFVSYIRDKFGMIAGMTAIDEDATTDEGTDESPDESGEPTDTNVTEEMPDDPNDNLNGEPVDEDPLGSNNEEKAERDNPTLDPNLMLLELVQPTENMADYVYREMVGKRISTILKNPPENARPNDLLMLKRWKSRWLYLASIACLRDFMARISLRLSDVK